MNNKIKFLFVNLLVFLFVASAVVEGSVTFFLSGNMLQPADKNYKLIYGNTKLLPEAKISMNLSKGIGFWAGFGYLSTSGRTPILHERTSSTQMLISGGLGYRTNMSAHFGISMRAGVLAAHCEETTMGTKADATAIGYVFSSGPYFYFSRNIGLEIEAGYSNAPTTIEDAQIKCGGFKVGMGLIVTF